MSTAQDLCDRMGRLLFGKAPTTAESADALIGLNGMLGAWNNEGLLCYAVRDESLTLNGSTSYSVGSGGTLDTTRPVEVIGAYVVLTDGSSVSVPLMEAEEYAAIVLKTSTATYPEKVWYQPAYPLGLLYPWPLATGISLHILTRTPLTAFATLTTAVSLPPGWEEMIPFNLAVRMAPEFQVSVRPEVMKVATETLASVKRANSRPIEGRSELATLFGPRRSNILTGR